LQDQLRDQTRAADPAATVQNYFAAAPPMGDVPGIRTSGTLVGEPLQCVTEQLINISIETYESEIQWANGDEEAVLCAIIGCCHSSA